MPEKELEEEIKRLRLENQALQKTKIALMNRVERSVDSSAGSFSLLERNIHLQDEVTERTRKLAEQNEEMKVLADRAQQASQAKGAFLANMSHEIRSPINAVIGYIDLLRDMDQDGQTEEYLEIIHQSSRLLLSIINDILDYSKIEANKIKIHTTPFDPRRVLSALVEMFQVECQRKEIELLMKLPSNLPAGIETDQLRLSQILTNLLSNAVKFTDSRAQKRITLDVAFAPSTEKAKGALSFSVIDEGIGIPENALEKIFQAFSQASSSTNSEYGGTGLGLTITSRLVSLLGGDLKVSSQVGQGSCFSFTIPVRSSESGTGTEDKGLQLPTFSGKRGLLVEDNPINQGLMKALFKKMDFSLDISSNGKEALEVFDHQTYDIILMDENMPVMNGIEATLNIRKRERERKLSPTPILGITANAMPVEEDRFRESGMNDHIAKPVIRSELISALLKLL